MKQPPKTNPPRIRWVEEDILARASRPGYPADDPYPEEVEAWLELARRMGIRSVLCLLSAEQLEKYYVARGIPLLDRYRQAGLSVDHLPVKDYQCPALDERETGEALRALFLAEKPVVIHCSAGFDRTGHVVEAWQQRQSALSPMIQP